MKKQPRKLKSIFSAPSGSTSTARVKRGLPAAVALVGALLCSQAQAGSPFGPPTDSLRLLTYNAAFLYAPPPGPGDINEEMFGMTYEERANRIAERILAIDPDVVVLNEMFSWVARHKIKQKLASKYPSYIENIDEDAVGAIAFVQGDAGLMIFSKDPFVEFSPGTWPPYNHIDSIQGYNGATSTFWNAPGQIAVRTYRDCHDYDCAASKAVAMVRIRRASGEIINVAFSHTQADYSHINPSLTEADRAAQYEDIHDVIVNSLTDAELRSQGVYVLGDLNTVGENQHVFTNGSEWQSIYGGNGFFACGDGGCSYDPAIDKGTFLVDSWGWETSDDDPGITNDFDGKRFDYILHSKPRRPSRPPLCMQHVKVAYELGEQTPEGFKHYSDHYGILADFNNQAARCSANDEAGLFGPAPVEFPTVADNQFNDPETKIAFPGSMQWYRIDHPGSYSIQVHHNSEHVKYLVYHNSDLSRPLGSFHKTETRWGPRYAMPDPPYYIRAFAYDPATGNPDRGWTGNYSISFHQHRGLSADDAIALPAGAPQRYDWPGPNFIPGETPDTRVWFDFYTDVASSGGYPSITLYHETHGNVDHSLQYMEIIDSEPTGYQGGQPVYEPIANQPVDVHDSNNWLWGMGLDAPPLEGGSNGPRRYFLRMWRDPLVFGTPNAVNVTFGTTMTYFRPLTLRAVDAWEDDPKDDQLTAYFAFDGIDQPDGVLEFDSDQIRPLSGRPKLSGSYVEELNPILVEESEGQLWFLYESWIDILYHNLFLETYKMVHEWKFIWADAYNSDDADLWYEMRYARSQEPFPSCADEPEALGCIPW